MNPNHPYKRRYRPTQVKPPNSEGTGRIKPNETYHAPSAHSRASVGQFVFTFQNTTWTASVAERSDDVQKFENQNISNPIVKIIEEQSMSQNRPVWSKFALTCSAPIVCALACAILLIASISYGQSDTLWSKQYGDAFNDGCSSIIQLADSNFAVGGYFGAYPWAETTEFWAFKINPDGELIWEGTFGGQSSDICNAMISSSDGGFLLIGWTESFGEGGADVFALKISSEGDSVWSSTYGGEGDDFGVGALADTDSTYVIIGITSSPNGEDTDACVLRISDDGDLLWEKQYGGEEVDICTSIISAGDNGYVIAGVTKSAGNQNGGIWLFNIDHDGDVIWERTYSIERFEYAKSIVKTANDEYILAGGIVLNEQDSDNIALLKTDSNGDSIWFRTYGGEGIDYAESIISLNNGDYLLSCLTNSWGAGGLDILLMRITEDGDSLWSMTVGTEENEFDARVAQDYNGGYLIGGTSFTRYQDEYESNIILWMTERDQLNSTSISPVYLPEKIELYQPYPSPFNQTINLVIAVPITSYIRLSLVNLAGQKVMSISDTVWSPGVHQVPITSKNMASGVYWVVLDCGNYSLARKVVLIR